MKNRITSTLLSFYFGTLSEKDRLDLERNLLLDSGLLTEYFDLKRKIEAAETIPLGPSKSVWLSLSTKLKTKKRFFIPLALGTAIAASVFIFITVIDRPLEIENKINNGTKELIFDSNSELPASSNVI